VPRSRQRKAFGLPVPACLFFLFAGLLKKLPTDFDEIFGGVRRGPRKNRLDFGSDPDDDPIPGSADHDPDSGFLEDFYLLLRVL